MKIPQTCFGFPTIKTSVITKITFIQFSTFGVTFMNTEKVRESFLIDI